MGRPADAQPAALPAGSSPGGQRSRRATLAAGSSRGVERSAGPTLTLWRRPHPQLARHARPSAGSVAGGKSGKGRFPLGRQLFLSHLHQPRIACPRASSCTSSGAAPAAARPGPSVSRGRPCGWSPPPAEVLCDRIPLAVPLTVLPTVAVGVPSTDSAAFDHAPAGGPPRPRSANVNVGATVSSRLRTQRCLAHLHQPRVAKPPGKPRGTERWFKPPAFSPGGRAGGRGDRGAG